MKIAGKKILVTGAGGFIGSHLVEALIDQGCEVIGFIRYNSRNDRGWLDSFPESKIKKIKVIAGDLKDSDAVRQAVRGCDVVFHLGALIGIPYSYVHPRNYVETNVIGTTNVLSACLEYGVKRLVHVSTSEVYGTAHYVPIDEKHPKVGQSPYAATKIAADALAESFYRTFKLPVTIIRPFNTYGPRQSLRAVIPTIIGQLLDGGPVSLGSTHPTRDFTFVEDTVSGLIRGAEVDKVVGKTINLGSGSEVSIGDLAEKIAQILGKSLKIKKESERLRPEESEVERLLSDNSLARELLQWRPKVTLDQGLKKTASWFKENLTDLRLREYII